MAIFGPKPWLTPLEKIMSIFRLFGLLIFRAQKVVFSFKNIVKDIFLAYIANKKVGKMAIFGPKSWVNPFGKMSISRLFELVFFVAKKGVFSLYNIIKDIFLAYIAQKEKLEEWPFFNQKHGLNPLEKCQFFDCLNFLFLQPRKVFFPSRIS